MSNDIMDFLTNEPSTAPFPVDPLTSSSYNTSSTPLASLELPSEFESSQEGAAAAFKCPRLEHLPQPKAKPRKFAPPKTEQEIETARKGAIPKKTQSDTKYCIGMWNEWKWNRLAYYGENIPDIAEIPSAELSKLLSRFILEVRKKNGEEFPPDSLLHIASGLQQYLRLNGQLEIDVRTHSCTL